MPSGISARLTESKDLKEWMLAVIPRMFGVCMSLRDDPYDMSVKDIQKSLKNNDFRADSVKRYKEQIADARKELAQLEKLSPSDWEMRARESNSNRETEYKKRLKEVSADRAIYEPMLMKLGAVQAHLRSIGSTDELLCNAVKAGMEQIESLLKWDYSLPEKPTPISMHEYMDGTLNATRRSLAFYEEKLAEEEPKVGKNHQMYSEYVVNISKLLDEVEALEAIPPPELRGVLSNEASQDSEGNPVYVFLDEKKEGYEAWVNIKSGDHLTVLNKKNEVVFKDVVRLKVSDYTLDKLKMKAEWFNKGFSATLVKKDPLS